MASSFLRFLEHRQWRTTVGRTPLDEWSARRKDLYLTTHNTHNRQTSMSPGGIRTQDLNRRATADLRLRPRGHWDPIIFLISIHKIFLENISFRKLSYWGIRTVVIPQTGFEDCSNTSKGTYQCLTQQRGGAFLYIKRRSKLMLLRSCRESFFCDYTSGGGSNAARLCNLPAWRRGNAARYGEINLDRGNL